nr:Crp/Fnr family transcriptional regulator [Paenibacillus sp. CAA11]
MEESEWRRLAELTAVKFVPKGTRLIEAGEHVTSGYFCGQGLFRLFYTLEDGQEYNVGFSLENDYVTSYGAMVTGRPSAYTVEAMEDSAVIDISQSALTALTAHSLSWERFIRHCVERLYIRKEERERELLYLSARERYEAFLLKYPGLDRRIPQYHIASYIGVSPVSLSRLLRSKRN